MANPQPNLSRKLLALCKTETTSGTNAFGGSALSNIAAADHYEGGNSYAQLLWDETNPLSLDTEVVEQQSVRASYSRNQDLIGRQLWNFRPKTMLMSSVGHSSAGGGALTGTDTGIKGEPPFYSHLLRACALEESYPGNSSSVIYKPRSKDFESCSAAVWADTHFVGLTGLFGNLTIEGRGGEGISLDFDMKGNYSEPEHTSIPTTTTYPLDGKTLIQNEGIIINAGNENYQPIIRSFRFDLGNQIIERRDMNSGRGLYGLFVADRNPTLEIVIEVDTIDNFNVFSNLSHATTGAVTTHYLEMDHNDTPDEIIFRWYDAQMTNVQYQDDQGIRTFAITYNLTAANDDKEFDIKFL